MVKVEYIWLDGYKPEPNLRSKVKTLHTNIESLIFEEIPEWGFDGSSTKQAEGNFSDCILVPVRMYKHSIIKSLIPTVYVICEVIDAKTGEPHESNKRSSLPVFNDKLWVGFEQEYFIRVGHKKPILGFHDKTNELGIDPQGKYYCGVGGHVVGRDFVDEHLDYCLSLGIDITGTNAEVALGQWEFQVFSKGARKACDDLWMSRYILDKLSEKYGYKIELHPKPIETGDWNGSGLHTNFSTEQMRNEGGFDLFENIFKVFEERADQHIKVYGSDNVKRLTGKHETQSIDKFSWGVSDRGASIRVPKSTAEEWKGYLEDRRPASNANPYEVIKEILTSLQLANNQLRVEQVIKTLTSKK